MSKKTARSKYALLEHSTKRTCDIAHTVSVGREKTDLVFSSLVSLSRKHFKIIIDSDGAYIEDLGSSNGTLLNKHKLDANAKHLLSNGDSIIAGKVVFTFLVRPTLGKEGERDLGVPLPPVSDEERLSPEISLEIARPDLALSSKPRTDNSPISMLAHNPESASKPKKKKRYYSSMSQQWTTVLMATSLGFVGYEEFTAIQNSGSTGPHSIRDVLLRYLFAVGLMYVSMVVIQFIFVITIARRWYLAICAMVASAFFGTMIGDRLDHFAEYRKAEVENNLQTLKISRAISSDRFRGRNQTNR